MAYFIYEFFKVTFLVLELFRHFYFIFSGEPPKLEIGYQIIDLPSL